MGRLSGKEIEAIVEKIRRRHEEGAARYGGGGFNRKAFDERYLRALRDRVDLETFLYAEVAALEELTRRAEKAAEEARIRSEMAFSKRVDAMVAAMRERIRAYPALGSEAGLPEEVSRFCGAVGVFLDGAWYPLRRRIPPGEVGLLKGWDGLTPRLERFCVASGRGLPYEAERFRLAAAREGEEKATVGFFRGAAAVLREVSALLGSLGVEAEEARRVLRAIVEDFRLRDLV